jgi:outer membrane protein insertion porin family
VLEADLLKLQKIYQKKGFLDVEITARRQFNEDKSKIRITFAVVEGKVYNVGNIFLSGNEYFEEVKLREMLRVQAGQVYNEQRCKSDLKRLLDLYLENGFIDAKVEQRRRFVSEDRVDVEFAITQGERFRIGRINITGNEQTHDKVVRRVLDEYDFQPGQWYNADMARGDGRGELEKMIRQIALTESATITATGEQPGQRDAQVSIIEGQTGSIMLGGAVASDSGLIGQLVFDQRNFDITDWPESFGEFITGQAFKGAGQSLRIALQPGTIVSEYLVSFTEPYFMDKPVSLDLVGSSWEREREAFNEERMKGYIGLEKRYKNRWRSSIGFRAENVDVASIDAGAPTEVTSVRGDNAIMGINVGIGRDLTDNRFTPSDGDVLRASYEQVTGDHTFGIVKGSYGFYTTLHEDLAERKTVLATKFLAATIVGGDAPVFEKFYAGGTGLYGMRGFDYRGVSTRGRNTITGKIDDPIGSDWIFLASAEVTVPLVAESLSGLIFVDSGTIDSGNYRASAGVGVQILIPQWFGPVPMRFELAAPFMKEGEDELRVFSFSIGRLF